MKCVRQCKVLADAVGRWRWWACLCWRVKVRSTFSQHVGHSTWEPIQAASHGSDCAERLLAEENICCHADIQAIYSMGDGGKKVWMDVSEEKNNEEGGMDWL